MIVAISATSSVRQSRASIRGLFIIYCREIPQSFDKARTYTLQYSVALHTYPSSQGESSPQVHEDVLSNVD